MLEKIENISRNKPYKGKRHSTNFDKYFNKDSAPIKTVKDSINFSPAALYLSSLKWDIREIEYPSSDDIAFTFFIGEFEFRTKINLTDFFIEPLQLFSVSKTEIRNNTKNKIVAKININKLLVKTLTTNSDTELEVFRKLFGRIKSLKNHNSDAKNTLILNDLSAGYEKELFYEFRKIINSIYTFINKQEKFHIPNRFKFKDNNFELVKIEEISTYYS